MYKFTYRELIRIVQTLPDNRLDDEVKIYAEGDIAEDDIIIAQGTLREDHDNDSLLILV